jgi:hypothetical protein
MRESFPRINSSGTSRWKNASGGNQPHHAGSAVTAFLKKELRNVLEGLFIRIPFFHNLKYTLVGFATSAEAHVFRALQTGRFFMTFFPIYCKRDR